MTDIENQWARNRVESMADGSLPAADAQRMREAMAREPALREAVERAARLRRELGRLGREPVPRGLRRRLLRIGDGPAAGTRVPAPRRPVVRLPLMRLPVTRLGVAVSALAAVAVVAVLVAMSGARPHPGARLNPGAPPASSPAAAVAAAEDRAAVENFQVAMAYLQRSTLIAGAEVSSAIGSGLRDALVISRKAVRDTRAERKKGG